MWNLPEEYGSAIFKYEIQIQTSLGAWEEETSYCDGSLNVIGEDRECEIPLSVLRQAPISLGQNDPVVV